MKSPLKFTISTVLFTLLSQSSSSLASPTSITNGQITIKPIEKSCANELRGRLKNNSAETNNFCDTYFNSLIYDFTQDKDMVFDQIRSRGEGLRSKLSGWWQERSKLRSLYFNSFRTFLTNLKKNEFSDARARSRILDLLENYIENGGDQGVLLFQDLCQKKLGTGESSRSNRNELAAESRQLCGDLVRQAQHINPDKKNQSKESIALLWTNLTEWVRSHRRQPIPPPQQLPEQNLACSIQDEPTPLPNIRKSFQELRKFGPRVNAIGDNLSQGGTFSSSSGKLTRRFFSPMKVGSFSFRKSFTNLFSAKSSKQKTSAEKEPATDTKTAAAQIKRFPRIPGPRKIPTLDREKGSDDPIYLGAIWSPAPKGKDPMRIPSGGRANMPTVILFHGNEMTAEQMVAYEKFYNFRGINTLAVTMRGYPGSGGDSVRDGELGMYLDAEAAVRYAVDVLGIPKENLFVHGYSIGGALAASAAYYFDLPAILDRTFTSAKEVAVNVPYARQLPKSIVNSLVDCAYPQGLVYPLPEDHLSTKKEFVTDGLNTLEKLKKTKSDVFVFYAENDEMMPTQFADSLLKAKYPPRPGESDQAWRERVSEFSGNNTKFFRHVKRKNGKYPFKANTEYYAWHEDEKGTLSSNKVDPRDLDPNSNHDYYFTRKEEKGTHTSAFNTLGNDSGAKVIQFIQKRLSAPMY